MGERNRRIIEKNPGEQQPSRVLIVPFGCTNLTVPTGALNSKTGLDVLDTLSRFNEEGQSVVMVTHDMRSARRGNRILYLKDGSVLGECDLGRYVSGDRARHEKLAAFLGEMGW